MYEDWHAKSQTRKEQLWNQLVPLYENLSLLERQMVRLVAIAYEPVARGIFAAMLQQVGVQHPRGKAWTTAHVKPYCERLIADGLLVAEQRRGMRCQPAILEVATRDAIAAGEFKRLSGVVQQLKPLRQYGKSGPLLFDSEDQFVREVRIALYRGDWKAIQQYERDFRTYSYYRNEKLATSSVLVWVSSNPFDGEWLASLSPAIYETALSSILTHALCSLESSEAAWEQLIRGVETATPEPSERAIATLVEQYIFRGELEEAARQLDAFEPERHERCLYGGWLSFLKGENAEAIAQFEQGLKRRSKETGKRKNVFFKDCGGLFFVLALLKDGSPQRLQQAIDYLNAWNRHFNGHWLQPSHQVLAAVTEFCQSGNPGLQELACQYGSLAPNEVISIEHLINALCIYWLDKQAAQESLPVFLDELCGLAERAGYYWLAEQFGDLSIRAKLGDRQDRASIELRKEIADANTLADIVRPREPWEFALDALVELQPPAMSAAEAVEENNKRLAWFLTWYASDRWSLQPREQKIGASGQWSKGRPVALKRLYKDPDEFTYCTAQDRLVCGWVRREQYGPYGYTEYRLASQALKSLVGHPLVFLDDGATRMDLVAGEPELRIEKGKSQQLTVKLVPPLPHHCDVLAIKEASTRLKVIEITAKHRRIASILGDSNQLKVPESARERLRDAIAAASSHVAVQSDIGGVSNLREVPAESKPHFQILPVGEGLKVAARVRPFATGGPDYVPGEGSPTAIAEVAGERLQTNRDLQAEKQRLDEVLAALPTLTRHEEAGGEWSLAEPDACLEMLLELQELGEGASVEWPEGEKLRVGHRADASHFQLSLAKKQDWFAIDGSLQLDNNLVLDMQELLDLLARTPGRFLPLGDGQFLALTQSFRKRLEELRAFATKRGNSYGLHPLTAHAIEDFTEEVGKLKADKHWRERVRRLREMETLQPQVPSTLQAELRDYQQEGFCWLARLAHWGVGACLADDMGLGKTLQALAVVLTRAPQGPTLAIAPTSVCGNWEAEASKFAPTLNLLSLDGDRQQLLDRLQPFDLLVCSYGLLQQEDVAAMLAKVSWETVILDEAQAIKNAATKRSRAAMSLQAGFKLILTGTPIENHLGELWTLFQFINPGLLGSLESFNQRFAYPIERDRNKQARERLKKLIRPFLLRRRKSQVLEELPARTEIALRVELSLEERAFYEALRREALANVSDSKAAAGQKHLQVLAEIMRLRRACCHPRLANDQVNLPSAKLKCFGEVLAELLENNHKALVFSQFVDHLQIVREYLETQTIRYQYLDGSTRAADRRKRVQAFQAGEGDVFLISLKAGGTGLNLTAADYVIHLDPWWNPAVEDQASDRAHRIGQQRPVTIYRLVTVSTIEEKIIDLHRHKRDLADSLLAGTDAGGKLSTHELLKLMGA
ncbi:superfamily II DNA/RNA helicase, SNF2 family [Rubidibacter lacunae KORDI 51-2]|uniref:Superfamily II DNA/RNA helicase, SNF2 family n=1 Tax=Rubidibacter lacunae KORDI 51-2 TaxID=582515 RepID=U5DF80_9CHRO|nr:DEAD/DEAH box helicase [Rubidibacter lacunae]ERN43148.1 superfamily II DNA/RNA helicase, SNF2 family [Rubidibacter lacunae KORDI 51-2]